MSRGDDISEGAQLGVTILGFDFPPSFTFKIVPMNQPTAHLTTASIIQPTTTMTPVPTTAKTAICFLERMPPPGLIKATRDVSFSIASLFALRRATFSSCRRSSSLQMLLEQLVQILQALRVAAELV